MTINDLDLAAVLGNRAARYLPRFQALLDKTGGDLVAAEKARGWNWGAFLAGPFWLIYHRAYAMGAAVIGVILVLAISTLGLPAWLSVRSSRLAAMPCCFGLSGANQSSGLHFPMMPPAPPLIVGMQDPRYPSR